MIVSLFETCNREDEYEIGDPTIIKVQKNVDKADETDKGIKWAERHMVSTITQSHRDESLESDIMMKSVLS